jgi:hypothetical protein
MRFLDIDMPDEFVLEIRADDGQWIEHAFYSSDLFGRNDDGTYVCAGQGGSPMFLRCVRQRGQYIDVLDGGGFGYTYRLIPIPSDRYPGY